MFTEDKIISIRKIGVKKVCDISVSEDNSYVGNGFVNHNSSSKPNMQNIPRDSGSYPIREAFHSRGSRVFIGGDYGQLELRVMAHMSKDKLLIDAYKHDKDIHQITTDNINKLVGLNLTRSQGKTTNFSILYGMSGKSLAYELNKQMKEAVKNGKMSYEDYMKNKISDKEGQKIVNGFFDTYKGFAEYSDKVATYAKINGFASTLTGRIRHIPELQNRSTFYQGKRYAVSTAIQGSAADIVKKAMADVFELLKSYDANIILQVHDEILVDCLEKDAEELRPLIQNTMENVWQDFAVPLKCDMAIIDNWGELKTGIRKGDKLLELIKYGII